MLSYVHNAMMIVDMQGVFECFHSDAAVTRLSTNTRHRFVKYSFYGVTGIMGYDMRDTILKKCNTNI